MLRFTPWLKKKVKLSRLPVHFFSSRIINEGSSKIERSDSFDFLTICWMGSIENPKRKGVDIAIRLIRGLKDCGIPARLFIAGDSGPGRIFLEDLVSMLNLVDSVIFLGPISEKQKEYYFQTVSGYIQLSSSEGFGLAAAEAFLSGVPVIHSNQGGLKEVIGNSGFICEVSNMRTDDVGWIRKFIADFEATDFPTVSDLRDIRSQYSIKKRSSDFFG
jgi:glycosyltransferase involved in cell wall biosynthesis